MLARWPAGKPSKHRVDVIVQRHLKAKNAKKTSGRLAASACQPFLSVALYRRPIWIYGNIYGNIYNIIYIYGNIWFIIPSGKRLHNELENHHAINGKTHYKWTIFNSYVSLPEGIHYELLSHCSKVVKWYDRSLLFQISLSSVSKNLTKDWPQTNPRAYRFKTSCPLVFPLESGQKLPIKPLVSHLSGHNLRTPLYLILISLSTDCISL